MTDQSMATQVGQARHSSHFARHLVEMIVAMMIGMLAGAAAFLAPQGLTPEEGLRRFPVLFVVVMAVSMTVPMVAWMRYRGHGWRSCNEMGAAMVVPAIPLIGLYWLGVITAPFCGLYCAASFVAMVAVMVLRRNDYTM
jgi:hypothetical protein